MMRRAVRAAVADPWSRRTMCRHRSTPAAVDGADVAAGFLEDRGLDGERARVVWEAIALHTSLGIAHRMRPEIALTHAGAAPISSGWVRRTSRRASPRGSTPRSPGWRRAAG